MEKLTPEERKKFLENWQRGLAEAKQRVEARRATLTQEQLNVLRENCGHLGVRGGICDNCGDYVTEDRDPEYERQRLEKLRPSLLSRSEMEDLFRSNGLGDYSINIYLGASITRYWVSNTSVGKALRSG